MSGSSTIEISNALKQKLKDLASGSELSLEQLILKLLSLIPEGDDEGKYSPEFRRGLLNAKLEIENDEFLDHATVKEMLDL